jgi:HPt (histidine-containing phosphotransfer) domain-containing protein
MTGNGTLASVDFAYLSGIVAHDAGLVDEVLEIFGQQAALWRPRLADSAEGWRETAHTIKGASRGVGANALGDACEQAELKGDGDLGAVRAALETTMAEVIAYRAAYRGG